MKFLKYTQTFGETDRHADGGTERERGREIDRHADGGTER